MRHRINRAIRWIQDEVLGLNAPILVLVCMVPVLSWASVIMQQNGYLATTLFPILMFMLAMFGVGAGWVWQHDKWLGALCSWWVVSLFWTRTPQAFETTMLSVLGVVALLLLRTMSVRHRLLSIRLVVLGAVAVSILALVQATGFDPVWWTEYGSVSTFGNTAYVACLVAVVLPFAPIWSVPILVGALIVTKASLPMLAAMLGLAWRFRQWRWQLAALALPMMGAMVWLRGTGEFLHSQVYRFDIWKMALANMTWKTWIYGNGPGSWFDQIPKLQDVLKVHPGYYFTYAHNEWLQLIWEAGAGVGLVLMVGWLWSHRTMFASPYGGSVVAMLVLSTGWFIFHLPNVVPTLLIVLGSAVAWVPSPVPAEQEDYIPYMNAIRTKGLVYG